MTQAGMRVVTSNRALARSATIGERLRGHDNNFNLIRFLAAAVVLLDHSVALVGGSHQRDLILGPFSMNLNQVPIGHIAVDTFFVVSGFLVAKSALTRQNLAEFGVARILRLFPALLVVSMALAFVLGPLISDRPLSEYFADFSAWAYVPLTASLATPMATLPGVFAHVPVANIVNSPLWTLRYEATCYVLLGLLAVSGALFSRRVVYTLAGLLAAYLLITFATPWRAENVGIDSLSRFGLSFFIGAGLYALRQEIRLSWMILLALAGLAAATAWTNFAELTFRLALGYGVVWMALVPVGRLRNFNRLGDYSYGLYIWCWPVQQTIVTYVHGLTGPELFLISFPVTLLFAVLSWHLVEHPALRHKNRVGNKVRQVLDRWRHTPRPGLKPDELADASGAPD